MYLKIVFKNPIQVSCKNSLPSPYHDAASASFSLIQSKDSFVPRLSQEEARTILTETNKTKTSYNLTAILKHIRHDKLDSLQYIGILHGTPYYFQVKKDEGITIT